MRKLLPLIILLFVTHLSKAQSWLWGSQPNFGLTASLDVAGDHSVTVDKSGNAYFVSFTGEFYFGKDSTTNSGIAIAKYDSSGNVIWVKQSRTASARSGGEGYGVALDASNNIYVTGEFSDTIYFAKDTLIANGEDVFIAKYDASGNEIWARQAKIPSAACSSFGYSIAMDNIGDPCITGYFKDTIYFGATMLKGTSAFIVKYNSSGNIRWAKQALPASSACSAGGNSLVADSKGNIYVTGGYTDTIAFGPFNLYSNSSIPFLVKYDSSGNVVWARDAKSVSKTCNGTGNSIAIESSGDIYITGIITDTLTFGSIVLHGDGLEENDVYLAKYDPYGNVIWAEQGNTPGAPWWGVSVACDTQKKGGGVLVATTVDSGIPQLDFGKSTFKISTSYSATVLLEFDSSGRSICGNMFSEGVEDDGDALAVDKAGKYFYFFGDACDTMFLGKDTLPYGGDGPFLARWQPCTGSTQGINEMTSNQSEVILFPNPNKGVFDIQLKIKDYGLKIVEVYNVLGEKVYSTPLNLPQGGDFKMHLDSPSGIYLYRVTDEKGNSISSGKFVIEK